MLGKQKGAIVANRYRTEGDVYVEEDNSLPYFFLGLGLGVAAGILFAPKTGEETRQLLKAKAQEGAEYVKRRSSDLQETAAEAVERSKQTLQRSKESLNAAVEAGRQAYREAANSEVD
ncbi:MAG: YtxH domain-containing protein [Acidobacteriota bacterium]